jgi:hypothetical protein
VEHRGAERIPENPAAFADASPEKNSSDQATETFPSLLRRQLAAAGIELANGDFDAVASQLIAAGADCEAFVDHAIRKSRGKDNPRVYLLQGILKYDWAHKDAWRKNGAPPKPVVPQRPDPPRLEDLRAEREAASPADEAASILAAAKMNREHHVALSLIQIQAMHDAGEELSGRELAQIGLAPAPTEDVADNFPEVAP